MEGTTSEDSTASRSLRQRLYGLGFVDEFGPVYALYTIFFLDNGITAAQISAVFLMWAVIEIAFEVPSGALADLVDRRKLLAFAFGLRAAGIAVWMIEPSYTGVIVGAALWSIHESLASGAWEALIHDELTAIDEAPRYANVMARIEQFSAGGIALGAAVATVTVALGATIRQLGWLTVAIHLVSIVLVLALPDVRWVKRAGLDEDADEPGWRETLVAGLSFCRRSPIARRLISIGSMVGGLYILDDYVPLLADERGTSEAVVPIFVIVIFLGLVVGDELVARRPRMSGRTVGVLFMVGAAAMLAAMLATPAWPLLLVGVGYATQEIIWMISDARFQEHVPAATRATATSVRSFGAGVVSIVALGAITLASGENVPNGVLAVMAGVMILTGAVATRWIPESAVSPRRRAAT